MNTEDEEFERIERESGWRKRQIVQHQEPMSITAMKQALEGLDKWRWGNDPRGAEVYIESLRQAIEQAEQAHVDDGDTSQERVAETSKNVHEPVVHCEAGPGHCPVCLAETRSLALAGEVNKKVAAPAWWPAVENILNEYGLQAIDFVSDFKNAMQAQPQETTRKPLTDEEIEKVCIPLGAAMLSFTEVARAIEAAHNIKGDA